MLRLTVISQTKEEIVLKVEGWVSGTDVALLEEEGSRLLQRAERLVLDVEGVKSINRVGIALLRRWWDDGLVLRGTSPFLHALFEQHGLTYACDAIPGHHANGI